MRTRVIRRRRRGFTLFEVLMVIVILGVLAAIIVPQFTGAGERAKEDLTRQQVTAGLVTPLELFKTHCGRYPTTDEGLKALFERPDNEEIKDKWAGPYVKTAELRDGWGHELRYQSPGQYNTDGFDLSSGGRNGQFGDEDDIGNWKTTK